MKEYLIPAFSAAIGATIKWIIPLIVEWIQVRIKSKKLLGYYHSEYQDIDGEPGSWVKENINMTMSFFDGKIKIKNSDSNQGYDYTGYGNLSDKSNLIGSWESIRPAANAYGCFMLTIDSQGKCIYGYWVGPDRTGARRFGRWVLAKDENYGSSVFRGVSSTYRVYA